MHTACLLVAGVIRAALPSPEFHLEWRHSIEHTRWREHYAVLGQRIALVDAWVEGMGAGMETGPGARFDGQGWSWVPASPPREAIVLTLSPYTSDYELCSSEVCRPLRRWVEEPDDSIATVTVTACDATPAPAPLPVPRASG